MRTVVAACAVLSGVLFAADSARRTPVAVAPAAAGIANFTVSPNTVTLTSDDPDASPSSGAAAVLWNLKGGNKGITWTLSVNAATASLSGCANVPVSAARVVCQDAVAFGGNGSGVCGAPVVLSTARQIIASGLESNGSNWYQVNLRVEFADKWRYIATGASQCSVTLTYTADAP